MEMAKEYNFILNEFDRLIENIGIDNLLRQFSSPLFVASERIIKEKYKLLEEELRAAYPNSKIAYSFKTNYVGGVCSMLKECGALAEVVSGFEYWFAEKLGYSPRDIIFNGPHKKDHELLKAVQDGCILNIDNWMELERLNSLLAADPRQASIGLRLNTNHGRNSSEPWSRFGFNIENGEAYRILTETRNKLKNLAVSGIHVHLGTNIEDTEQYGLATEKALAFISEAKKHFHFDISYLDMGGGFATSGNKLIGSIATGTPHIKTYIQAITDPISQCVFKPLLFLEPGRFLVAEGLILLTTVISAKELNGAMTATVDCSLPPLYKGAAMNFKISALKFSEKRVPTTVFGCSCTQHDIVGRAELPLLKPGDILAVHNVGAYTISRSSQWISSRPAVISIRENGEINLLRRREQYEDLVDLDGF